MKASILLPIFCAMAYLAQAQYSYTSLDDGAWTNGTTWSRSSGFAPSTPGVPLLNTSDNVTIAADHTIVIGSDMQFAVSNPNITVNGSLYILGDVLFKLGTITVAPGATLIIQGNLTMTDASTITNNGTFVVTGDFSMTNSTVVTPGSSFYIYGTRSLTGNGTFAIYKPWDNQTTAFSMVGDCATNQSLCDFATTSSLPVKLISFEGFVRNDNVVLKWSTASENNSKNFIIEKSFDGVAFDSLGSVEAAGESKSILNYSFNDYETLSSCYYRLKQTDFDGSYYYSSIIRLSLEGYSSKVKVYPNPSIKGQFINIDLGEDILSQIHIFSIDGKTDLVKTTSENRSFSFALDDNVKSGLYVINITSQNTIFSDLILIK